MPELQVPKKATAVQQNEAVDLPDIQEEATYTSGDEERPPMVDISLPLAYAQSRQAQISLNPVQIEFRSVVPPGTDIHLIAGSCRLRMEGGNVLLAYYV